MTESSRRVPVMFSFDDESARADSWGRFTELSATMATLSARCELRLKDRLVLSFEVGGRTFSELACVATWVETDKDGYTSAELRFTDEVVKRRLAAALLDILSRA